MGVRRAKFSIDHKSFDGVDEVRIGSGDNCVLVQIVGRSYAGAVLTADAADDLGLSLRTLARNSRTARERDRE